jgi:hypothetical protein
MRGPICEPNATRTRHTRWTQWRILFLRMPDIEPVLETAVDVERCPICGTREFRPVSTPGNPIGEPIFGPHLHQFRVCRCECGLELINLRHATQLLSRFYGNRIYDCHKMKGSATADRDTRAYFCVSLQSGKLPGRPFTFFPLSILSNRFDQPVGL